MEGTGLAGGRFPGGPGSSWMEDYTAAWVGIGRGNWGSCGKVGRDLAPGAPFGNPHAQISPSLMPNSPDSLAPRGFPATRDSLVLALTSSDDARRRRGFETMVATYWRPAYAHLRLRWRLEPADAEDLVQEFFSAALTQEFFRGYDVAQSRLRTFLRLCLDRFATKSHRAEHRLKRGGGATHLSLDFAGAEAALEPAGAQVEGENPFDREWVRTLFDEAIALLATECRQTAHAERFEVFLRYDLASVGDGSRPTYRALGEQLGIPTTQVTNHLAWARRRLRAILLERLRSRCDSPEEFQEEARALFGTET